MAKLSCFSKQLQPVVYPDLGNKLSFPEYIRQMRHIVEERRPDLQAGHAFPNVIIDANSPFEFYPDTPKRAGALLIHGLLDSPFSMRDIALVLSQQGLLTRTVLLQGHGTCPEDLLQVNYHDWIETVRYGVDTLRNEVEKIFLIGYSTGAALSIYHALNDKQIAGIILLSPAIRIKIPVSLVVTWKRFQHLFRKNLSDWITIQEEIDYAKYQSIPFNAVFQVVKLTSFLSELIEQQPLQTAMMMIVSHDDETISSRSAIQFFNRIENVNNEMLLYTNTNYQKDPRILLREAAHAASAIKHFSHIAIPFSPRNSHYGKNGDFVFASKADQLNHFYGAYNSVEQSVWEFIHKYGLIKNRRLALTYNPDFDYMMERILAFIFKLSPEISNAKLT